MYKFIILYLCVSFSCVLCDLDKEEGADCDWEGIKGKCVEETRCMTTLDTESPKQPVCSKKGEVNIICCTDCELVNDTRNVVITPTGLNLKDGRGKARDSCLQYIRDLPYQCHKSYNTKIKRHLDEDKMCHRYNVIGKGGPPALDLSGKAHEPYPHLVLIGFGELSSDPLSDKGFVGGSIISERFILTAAHISINGKGPMFVVANVQNRSESPSLWQTHKVKSFIRHPQYKPPNRYFDIALIETETPIKFDANILPACLHVDEKAKVERAIATTWRDVTGGNFHEMVDTINTIELEEFSEEECKSYYGPYRFLKQGLDYSSQMCCGNRAEPAKNSLGLSGEPLMIDTQFSHCVHTVIGVTTFGRRSNPDVYSRVSHYIPWIESVVWP